MKSYRRLCMGIFLGMVLVFLTANLLMDALTEEQDHSYRVEILRAERQIREQGLNSVDLQSFSRLKNISLYSEQTDTWGELDYVLRNVDGVWYRFEYGADHGKNICLLVNGCLGAAALFVVGVLLWVGQNLVSPFHRLSRMPAQLAKGNLTIPLKSQKNKYFGDYLWGMDMLRERLESQKRTELRLQKEKKTLLLSLTHDIKTPLSSMKLSAQALSRGLYPEPEKQRKLAGQIGENIDKIEAYIREITQASQEDFLRMEVNMGEFYLWDVLQEIKTYYKEKLDIRKMHLHMERGTDCLLKGDRERTVEVLQNLMENAIKYGKGDEIRLTAQEEGDCCLIAVKNQGCTLSSQEMTHLFDSFWRGSNSTAADGSGLGLYICRQLMGKMNGDIFAQSEDGNMQMTVVFQKA